MRDSTYRSDCDADGRNVGACQDGRDLGACQDGRDLGACQDGRDVGAVGFFWDGDHNENVHMTYEVHLDAPIDGARLQAAVEQALAVWPLLTYAFVERDGRQCLVPASAPFQVFESELVPAPLSTLTGERALTVSFFSNVLRVCGIHSLFDGHGLYRVTRAIVVAYCGCAEPARPSCDYLRDKMDVDLGPVNRMPYLQIPDEAFADPLMVPDDDGRLATSVISVPSKPFMAACRKLGASPAIMLFLLFARMVMRNNDDCQRVTSMITVDIRGVDPSMADSLFGNSAALYLTLTRDDLARLPEDELAQKLRADLAAQRDPAYLRTLVSMMQTGELGGYGFTGINTYMGTVSFGAADAHVTGYGAYNHTANTINLVEWDGAFRFYLQLGQGTETYTRLLLDELARAGAPGTVDVKPKIVPIERTE